MHTVTHTRINTHYTYIYQKYYHDTPLSCSLKKMPTTTASSCTRRLEQENTVHLDVRERWCKLTDKLNQCLFRKFFRYCKDRKTRSTGPTKMTLLFCFIHSLLHAFLCNFFHFLPIYIYIYMYNFISFFLSLSLSLSIAFSISQGKRRKGRANGR